MIRRWMSAAAVLVCALACLLAACTGSTTPLDGPTDDRAPSSSTSRPAVDLAALARTATPTLLGDVGTLDVCTIAARADLTGATGLSGVRLTQPELADVGRCTLGAGGNATIDVTVTTDATPQTAPFTGTPTPGALVGAPAALYPYDTDLASCPRVVALARPGVTTVFVRVVNRGGAEGVTAEQQCDLNDRVAVRFAAVAAGEPRPALTGALLGVDVCRAAGTGRVAAAVGADPATAQPLTFGTGCRFTTSDGTVDVLTGTLPQRPLPGAGRTVAGHLLRLLPDAAPSCAWASAQRTQALTARFTATGVSVAVDCPLASAGLVAYLDALGLR